MEQLRSRVNRIDQDVDKTIVIKISKRTTPGARKIRDAWTGSRGNVAKLSVAQIFVQYLWLLVVGQAFQAVDLRINMPIHIKDVEPAIVIDIEESTTPTEQSGIGHQSCALGVIDKYPFATVVIKIGKIVRKVGLENIQE